MDLFDSAFVDLWRCLNEKGVRYILVGGFATNLHGFQRFTGDVDLYLEDTPENRKKFRAAYFAYGMGDFASIETIQFVPGWIDFALQNGIRLDIMTSMKGVDVGFEECYNLAPRMEIGGQVIPVLHLNHLLDNKRAVARLKDQLDVEELEKIKKLLDQDQTGS
ncbi:Nucleotidyl transferase of unknown function [Cnuella takakiae]|uniref:Nucleotidyl transferase AbiEii toxin, Type IV TA system n=1 Tax=Cnuella takakiae TaxID=1302690 RepID=A0A1M5J1V3_9BACT|nr:nucleotidyltransferase [Cnuella takakiae]OLY91339.1 hypothetical protein BUE76_05065 [Cnuella takakiae]SHG34345.1 Nucleotidyl transferase of unknown function [Cnuella takakiae]